VLQISGPEDPPELDGFGVAHVVKILKEWDVDLVRAKVVPAGLFAGFDVINGAAGEDGFKLLVEGERFPQGVNFRRQTSLPCQPSNPFLRWH
jgi:hypothetical protein